MTNMAAQHYRASVVAREGAHGDFREMTRLNLEGYSDSDTYVTVSPINPYANVRIGPNSAVGTLRTDRSLEVTYEFISSAPAVKWFNERYAELENGMDVIIEGLIENLRTGERLVLNHGYLTAVKTFPDFGDAGLGVMSFTVQYVFPHGDYAQFQSVILRSFPEG